MTQQFISAKDYLENYKCGITLEYPYIDPVLITPCGHLFDRKSLTHYLKHTADSKCPNCRGDIILYCDTTGIRNAILYGLTQDPKLFEDVYFDMQQFIGIIKENKLDTPIGHRFITVLENASNHLNDAIDKLASISSGRELLRKKLNIKAGKVFFNNAEISNQSLQLQVQGKRICDWLDIQNKIKDIEIYKTSQQTSLFSITHHLQKNLHALWDYPFRFFNFIGNGNINNHTANIVNTLLQVVVHGQRTIVRNELKLIKKDNPKLLKMVLTSAATIPIFDYSGKKIEKMTLLQAAFAANDVAIHPNLAKTDPDHEGMCEIIESFFEPNDQTEIGKQYGELFKRALRENYPTVEIKDDKLNNPSTLYFLLCLAQNKNAFDFSPIVAAISNATLSEVNKALILHDASFTESNIAKTKEDHQLTLIEALNRFREQFDKYALKKIIANPNDLLRAIQFYNDHFLKWSSNHAALFKRQVIGFVERYLSVSDARVLAYGLFDVVEIAHKVPDNFHFRFNLKHHFYPLSPNRLLTGLGFDWSTMDHSPIFDTGYLAICFNKLITKKNVHQTALIQKAQISIENENSVTHTCSVM